MEKTVFAFDLDGTVMHSRRRHRDGDVCVEWIDGEEYGFMLRDTLEALLATCEKAELIPVTSRSVVQYRRIEWPDGIEPRIAFVDNGALLLTDYGATELRLRGKTVELENRLSSIADLFAKSPSIVRSRVVDAAYVLGILEEDAVGRYFFNDFSIPADFDGFVEGKKAYLFPAGTTKGEAVRRIRLSFPGCRLIAAGNALNDASMLLESDFAVGTAENEGLLPARSVVCPAEADFEAFVAAGLSLLAQLDKNDVNWGEWHGLAI